MGPKTVFILFQGACALHRGKSLNVEDYANGIMKFNYVAGNFETIYQFSCSAKCYACNFIIWIHIILLKLRSPDLQMHNLVWGWEVRIHRIF